MNPDAFIRCAPPSDCPHAPRPITPRNRMPAMRLGDIFELTLGGHPVRIQVSRYADGSPGEVWLDMAKEGAALCQFASGFAIAASLLLQHGASIETVAHSLEKMAGGPCGDVTGHDTIRSARSMVDLVAQLLRVEYGAKVNK